MYVHAAKVIMTNYYNRTQSIKFIINCLHVFFVPEISFFIEAQYKNHVFLLLQNLIVSYFKILSFCEDCWKWDFEKSKILSLFIILTNSRIKLKISYLIILYSVFLWWYLKHFFLPSSWSFLHNIPQLQFIITVFSILNLDGNLWFYHLVVHLLHPTIKTKKQRDIT